MNKRAAQQLATSGTLTFGDLRRAIATGRDRGGIARLNASLTVELAATVLGASIAGRPDDEVIRGTRDAIIATNILREFGAPPAAAPSDTQ